AYSQGRFTPLDQGVVDEGGCFYAPQSFTDAAGRRIMFGWLREGRDEASQRASGWAGVMSLPRLLLPRSDGHLGMQPVPELRALRAQHGQHTSIRNEALGVPRLLDVAGAALEIVTEIAPGNAQQVRLSVRRTPDG